MVADAPAVKPRVFPLRPVFEAFVATKQELLVALSRLAVVILDVRDREWGSQLSAAWRRLLPTQEVSFGCGAGWIVSAPKMNGRAIMPGRSFPAWPTA